MTTTDTQVPAWLNLEAFELPADALADVRTAIDGLLPLMPELDRLVRLGQQGEQRIIGKFRETPVKPDHEDDVREAIRDAVGLSQLWQILFAIEYLGGADTMCSGSYDDVVAVLAMAERMEGDR